MPDSLCYWIDRILGKHPMSKKARKALEGLAKRGGVPFGNFRCSTCGKSWPCDELAGAMFDYGEKKAYSICSFCKFRLGLVEFPGGLLGHGVDKDGHGYVDWDRIKSQTWTDKEAGQHD